MKLLLSLLLVGLILVSGCTKQEEIQFSEKQLKDVSNIENSSPKIEQKQYTETPKTEIENLSKNDINEPANSRRKIKNIKTPGYAELIDVSNGVVGSLSRDIVVYGVDISDPSSPKIIETIDTPGFAGAVYDDGEYLYVGDTKEFRVLSSSDPLAEPIGVYKLESFWPSTITVNENYAYLVSGNQMLVLNTQVPSNPTKASLVSLTGDAPTEIQIQDGYAYIIETLGGLNIVDIKDPAKPKLVKVIPFQSHTVGFKIRGNYVYLGRIVSIQSTETGYSTKSVFEIIDISTPASVKVVSSVEIPTDIRGLDISGNYAYIIGSYPYRLTAIDITSPTNPKIIDTKESIIGNAELQDIVVSDGYTFIADGVAGLRIVDIRDLANPVHIKDLDLEGRAFNIYQLKNRMYVNVEQKYFNIIDSQNPEDPKLAFSKKYTSGYPTASIVLSNGKAYFKENEFKIYDLSDPYKPKQLNQKTIDVDSIQVQENYLYSTIGEIGLLVYDIADLSKPTLVSKTPFPVGIPRDLSVDGKSAFGISNVPYSINFIDISNPEKPIVGDSYVFEKYPNTVTVKDNYAYVARGEEGVDIFQVRDGSLELVKNLKGEGYAHSVAVSGNKAFIVREGIEIFDVSDPKNPIFLDKIEVEGEATRVAVDNKYIYSANGFSGIDIILYA